MFIMETSVNASEGYTFGDHVENIENTVLDGMTRGEMFKWLQRENGRCISKVYVGDGQACGWVFVKRDRYEDTGEVYLRECWITLLDKYDTRPHIEYATL
jgi:hypothetical protein